MEIKLRESERGFWYADFEDLYGAPCSIQESSLATDNAIWFGVKQTRMHLNQEQAAALIPLLQRFIETGFLRA